MLYNLYAWFCFWLVCLFVFSVNFLECKEKLGQRCVCLDPGPEVAPEDAIHGGEDASGKVMI